MTVSVIIPTYNGAHKIRNVLHSVAQQTTPPDEVIVVIDGSTDNTREVLQQNRFPFKKFQIVEQANGGRAKVRNCGARHATGDLLIFFDDDMRPHPDCVGIHVQHQLKYPGSIMTGAQIEEVLGDTSDFIRFKAALSDKWYEPHSMQNRITNIGQLFLTAANFSIPKAIFQMLGGFDERLTDAEDYDLGVRAFHAGLPLFVNPTAHAWHDDPLTCRAYIRRQKQYSEAHKLLAELKPEFYRDAGMQRVQPTGVKAAIFSVFAHPWWVYTIDRNFWSGLLPRRLRYKLYDVVITAHRINSG